MLRLGLVMLLAGMTACDGEGRWPGARGNDDGPPGDDDTLPDADGGIAPPDAAASDGGPINASNIVVNGGFERMREDGSFATRSLASRGRRASRPRSGGHSSQD